jgi:hypothetical protein
LFLSRRLVFLFIKSVVALSRSLPRLAGFP